MSGTKDRLFSHVLKFGGISEERSILMWVYGCSNPQKNAQRCSIEIHLAWYPTISPSALLMID